MQLAGARVGRVVVAIFAFFAAKTILVLAALALPGLLAGATEGALITASLSALTTRLSNLYF